MLEELQRRNYAETTIRHYIHTVEDFARRFNCPPDRLGGISPANDPYSEEVAQLIDAARTPYHRTLLMTLYATGARRAELTHLKASDIDSQRMVIRIQGGKGLMSREKLCALDPDGSYGGKPMGVIVRHITICL